MCSSINFLHAAVYKISKFCLGNGFNGYIFMLNREAAKHEWFSAGKERRWLFPKGTSLNKFTPGVLVFCLQLNHLFLGRPVLKFVWVTLFTLLLCFYLTLRLFADIYFITGLVEWSSPWSYL